MPMTESTGADRWANYTIRNPSFVVFVVLLVAIMLLINVVVQLRNEGRRSRESRATVISLNAALIDCIEPTGKCAQRGRQQSTELIAASVICTNRRVLTKPEAIKCIEEVYQP